MADLKPIPIPASERWREFRYHGMPLIVFLGGILLMVFLWNKSIVNPALVGQVEAPFADVRSPNSGFLTNLTVTRFQKVKMGDVIGAVIATDVRLLDSEMTRLRGNIDVTGLELTAEVNREKMAFDYQDLRTEYNKWRVDLATAKVQLIEAESNLVRTVSLVKQGISFQAELDLATRNRDSLEAKKVTIEELLTDLQARLDQGKEVIESFPKSGTNAPLATIIRSIAGDKERWSAARVEPILLRAPISGTVTFLHRRAGEGVLAGEPIVSIAAEKGERIIAYLRQPITLDLKEGMPVKVRMRTLKREESVGRILQVGQSMQVITQALVHPGLTFELGLPIAVSLPAGLSPRPGELVDLAIDTAAR
jgi:multidrug resistance efflux pump